MEPIRKHFSAQLDELRAQVLAMGRLVEDAVRRSVRGAGERDPALAHEVVRRLEPEINRLEVELDQSTLRLMALQQPMAVDLRFLAAVLKIGNNLERMGDLAVNIAQGVPQLLAFPILTAPEAPLPGLAEDVVSMLHTALEALTRPSAALARQVLAADDGVDRRRDGMFRELIEVMRRDPAQVEFALALLFVTRNLERIADHATNIAEEVIFWVEGVDVRHHFQDI